MENAIYEIRVRAKLGYFSIYKINAIDVHEAKKLAREKFKSDFGCKDEWPETYCFNPHQRYQDEHEGELISLVD